MAFSAPFTRSDERWMGGVAAGLAHRLGIDPALTRSLFLLLTLAGGLGLIIYGVAWLGVPDADGTVLVRELFRGKPEASLVGGVVMIVIGLFRPILWLPPWFTYYSDNYSNPLWILYHLGLWALVLAAAMTAVVLVLSRRAQRAREKLGLEMVESPITRVFDEPQSALAAAPIPEVAPLTEILATADTADTAPTVTDAGPFTSAEAPLTKSWVTSPIPSLPEPAPPVQRAPKREPKPRRMKAGSRHLQATLAATLLSLVLVALVNDGAFSFRSIGHATGAVAIIWGISTAIAAARGRRAPGTPLIATFSALASIAALPMIAQVPAATLAVPLNQACPWDSGSRTCAINQLSYELVDAAFLDRLGADPLTITTGIGSTFLKIEPNLPVIITASISSGPIYTTLPGWTMEHNGTQTVLDSSQTYFDESGNEVEVAPTYINDEFGNRIDAFPTLITQGLVTEMTFFSPGAIPGESPEIHIDTGFGTIQLDEIVPAGVEQ
ncbi:MAG: PspC domain-containing protein [Ruaniaceae bacterium]|nr:PspC domain-containing protein [Ruaniaceae bacterium]